MNLQFTGPVIDIVTDKRGTMSLIVEERVDGGKPTPQKVECYGRGIDAAARGIHRGDVVAVEGILKASPWDPGNGQALVWFEKIQATFIEVKDGHMAKGSPDPAPELDDEPPF